MGVKRVKKIKVIGCGNLLAYDEGVGIHVVRGLQKEVLPENVEVRELRTPGQMLVELVSGADKLIIIDACGKGKQPGEVHRYNFKNENQEKGDIEEILSRTIHGFNLIPVFELRQKFSPEKLPREIIVFGIEVSERNKFGVGLSNPVYRAMEKIIQTIVDELY